VYQYIYFHLRFFDIFRRGISANTKYIIVVAVRHCCVLFPSFHLTTVWPVLRKYQMQFELADDAKHGLAN